MATATVNVPGLITVEVTATGAIPDQLELSKLKKHEVVWHAKEALVIRFPGRSPFAKSEFYIPAGGSVASGPILKEALHCKQCPHPLPPAHKDGHYKYTISRPTGPVLVDPQIIIRP